MPATINNSILKNLEKSRSFDLLADFREKKTHKFISLALTIAVLCIFGLLAIGPTFSTIAKLKREISDDQLVYTQLQQKINNLYSLEQQYNNLKPKLPAVLAAMPTSPQVPALVSQIQSLADSAGLTIINLNTNTVAIGKSNQQSNFSKFSFQLSASGSYQQMIQFISSVDTMQRIITIDNIVISQATSANTSTGLQLSFQGEVYFKN